MTRARLTTVSHVVLGLLASGPMTPYRMKQAVEAGLGHFWSFPHSQLYAEPARLCAEGLVTESREAAGRRRREYSITEAGRAALGSWLAEAPGTLTEIRDQGLLRLFFCSQTSPGTVRRLASAQLAAHRDQLDRYLRLSAGLAPDADPYLRATLDLGIGYENVAVEFWRAHTGPGSGEEAD